MSTPSLTSLDVTQINSGQSELASEGMIPKVEGEEAPEVIAKSVSEGEEEEGLSSSSFSSLVELPMSQNSVENGERGEDEGFGEVSFASSSGSSGGGGGESGLDSSFELVQDQANADDDETVLVSKGASLLSVEGGFGKSPAAADVEKRVISKEDEFDPKEETKSALTETPPLNSLIEPLSSLSIDSDTPNPSKTSSSSATINNTSTEPINFPPSLVRTRAWSGITPRRPPTAPSTSHKSHKENLSTTSTTSISTIKSAITTTFPLPASSSTPKSRKSYECILVEIGKKSSLGELRKDVKKELREKGLWEIPTLHGPNNLPYARCPSGIDAVLLSPEKDDNPYQLLLDTDRRSRTTLNRTSTATSTSNSRITIASVPLPGNSRYSQPSKLYASLGSTGTGRVIPGRVVSASVIGQELLGGGGGLGMGDGSKRRVVSTPAVTSFNARERERGRGRGLSESLAGVGGGRENGGYEDGEGMSSWMSEQQHLSAMGNYADGQQFGYGSLGMGGTGMGMGMSMGTGMGYGWGMPGMPMGPAMGMGMVAMGGDFTSLSNNSMLPFNHNPNIPGTPIPYPTFPMAMGYPPVVEYYQNLANSNPNNNNSNNNQNFPWAPSISSPPPPPPQINTSSYPFFPTSNTINNTTSTSATATPTTFPLTYDPAIVSFYPFLDQSQASSNLFDDSSSYSNTTIGAGAGAGGGNETDQEEVQYGGFYFPASGGVNKGLGEGRRNSTASTESGGKERRGGYGHEYGERRGSVAPLKGQVQRRNSANPIVGGGRKSSLGSSLAVGSGPRRPSIAPKTRLVKDSPLAEYLPTRQPRPPPTSPPPSSSAPPKSQKSNATTPPTQDQFVPHPSRRQTSFGSLRSVSATESQSTRSHNGEVKQPTQSTATGTRRRSVPSLVKEASESASVDSDSTSNATATGPTEKKVDFAESGVNVGSSLVGKAVTGRRRGTSRGGGWRGSSGSGSGSGRGRGKSLSVGLASGSGSMIKKDGA